MGTFILISVIISMVWFVKDLITLGHTFDLSKQWSKYVGAIVAGLLYIFLKGWDVFQYIMVAAVVVLFAYFFNGIVVFAKWLFSKFKK